MAKSKTEAQPEPEPEPESEGPKPGPTPPPGSTPYQALPSQINYGEASQIAAGVLPQQHQGDVPPSGAGAPPAEAPAAEEPAAEEPAAEGEPEEPATA